VVSLAAPKKDQMSKVDITAQKDKMIGKRLRLGKIVIAILV
jgi:hypothetical protein